MNDTTATVDALKARQTELEKRLQAIRKDLAGGLDADSAEQAIQLENYEVLSEIGRLAEKELAEVNKKLRDLDTD